MKRSIICVLLLFLWILPIYTVQAQESFVKGYMKENDKTLLINDTIAIWVVQEKKLHIYFYPFRLKRDEREKAAQGSAGLIPFKKSSPDESQWKWCPFGVLSVGFKDANMWNNLDDIIWANLLFCRLHLPNSTMNINRSGLDAKKIFKKFTINRTDSHDSINLHTKGEYESFTKGNAYSWDLETHTKILLLE